MTTQHRYTFLDALRGVAALCVGVLHTTQIFKLGHEPFHASLAVDFFFCLSGFVIAFAYDKKFYSGLTPADFMMRRLIRLYPLIIFSIGLGSIVLMLNAAAYPDFSMQKISVLIVSGIFLIPAGLAYGMQAYPVNNPIWSLFFEIFVKGVYAIFWRKPSRYIGFFVLGIIAILLAVAVLSASGLDRIGFGSFRDFVFGFFRVGYPFLAGILIFRFPPRILQSLTVSWIVPSLLLLVMLLNYGYRGSVSYDLLCALLLMPLIVALGSAVATTSSMLKKLFEWLGALSYPFYLIHAPVLRICRHLTESAGWFIGHDRMAAAASLMASILCAFIVLKLYDVPVRNWLTNRLRAAASYPKFRPTD
jgi:peptidoglycan/LPS O-acetylase OafA/YrhL